MTDTMHTLEIVDSELVEDPPAEVEPSGTILVPLDILKVINEAPAGVDILNVCIDIAVFLSAKNISYGNSALNPIHIFSKESSKEQLLVRIDDKLNRIKNGSSYPGDDDMRDLLGYFVLYHVAVLQDE